MKKHVQTSQELININKSFLALKSSQKEYINEEFYKEFEKVFLKNSHRPSKEQDVLIVGKVYEKIKEKNIWIPYTEIQKYYKSKKMHFNKQFNRKNIIIS